MSIPSFLGRSQLFVVIIALPNSALPRLASLLLAAANKHYHFKTGARA